MQALKMTSASADFKNGIGTNAHFKTDIGADADFKTDIGADADFKTDIGADADFKTDIGADACQTLGASDQEQFRICIDFRDSNHGINFICTDCPL